MIFFSFLSLIIRRRKTNQWSVVSSNHGVLIKVFLLTLVNIIYILLYELSITDFYIQAYWNSSIWT